MNGHDVPFGWETLAPLEKFDHPNLWRRPGNIVPAVADAQMHNIVAKECAGLRFDLRCGGSEMRRAFMSGQFDRRATASLRWLAQGMDPDFFPDWHSLCALTIYELARGMRTLGPDAGGYGEFLNRWAKNPDRPLPDASGWMLFLDNIDQLPPQARGVPPGDPKRRDIPSAGQTEIDVDGLLYNIPTSMAAPAP